MAIRIVGIVTLGAVCGYWMHLNGGTGGIGWFLGGLFIIFCSVAIE